MPVVRGTGWGGGCKLSGVLGRGGEDAVVRGAGGGWGVGRVSVVRAVLVEGCGELSGSFCAWGMPVVRGFLMAERSAGCQGFVALPVIEGLCWGCVR
jgi:hypothetical protein